MGQNYEATLLASAARTTTTNSPTQANIEARGCHVMINVTAIAATPSVVPKIQGFDPVAENWYDILEGDAITATGKTVLKVYPGIVGSPNASADDLLPKTWRVRMEHADTDSITYSVGANVVI